MFSKLRPLIFKVDPEKAHTLAIKSLKFNLIPNVFDENKNDSIFQTKIFNKVLDNPIGMAAGFDKNAEVYNALFKLGFGFVEVGTITPLKQYGNPKPRVFRLVEDEALINRLGFNNHGAEIVKDRIKRNKKLGLLGINIGPNKDTNDRLNDYLIGLKTFHEEADYITINISSPNTENLRNFHEGGKLQDLLKSVITEKKNLNSNIPIAVKVSPDISEDQVNQITEILLENEINVVIVSNTSDATRDKLSNIQRHQKGGLSGKPIEEKSNILINKFYKLLKGKIKIIGVGGVDSGQAAYDKFIAGADFVQLYTGMVFKGPNIAGMIKKDLKELLIRDGVKNYTEIVGNNLNVINLTLSISPLI
ncbi:quinone-dependent dihydroorotate dehydrogenase [Candidatus Pelagibacter bacterium]|nr:quinone-dependent dihydroorotate dehydrogenase [Candidatus Pelagibacter bacterium]